MYRLRDNASSFANGSNTRFTSSNICDYILLDDISKTLFLIECKSTKNTSLPFTMFRDNQINGLLEASKHSLIAGFLINFRNANNDTFFISIDDFYKMMNSIAKKSFNIKDLVVNNAVKIHCTKRRTRYTYNIQEMINTTQKIEEHENGHEVEIE
ncbi:Holliday junction resolvase RecU [Acetatifactor muris]|nr:Holliday junction resolvase RecU [Acetatifactor muris]